jgi:hypothetical protein
MHPWACTSLPFQQQHTLQDVKGSAGFHWLPPAGTSVRDITLGSAVLSLVLSCTQARTAAAAVLRCDAPRCDAPGLTLVQRWGYLYVCRTSVCIYDAAHQAVVTVCE